MYKLDVFVRIFAIKRRIVLFCLIAIVSVVVLEIWVMNRLSTYGEKIGEIEHAIESLRLENQILENKVAQKSSLYQLKKYGANLGLDKIKKIEYIDPNQDVFRAANIDKSLTVNAF